MLYIPPGFGHAFLVLTRTAHFLYKCTANYAPHADLGIRWDDPGLGIMWPVSNPAVSDKDARLQHPLVSTALSLSPGFTRHSVA